MFVDDDDGAAPLLTLLRTGQRPSPALSPRDRSGRRLFALLGGVLAVGFTAGARLTGDTGTVEGFLQFFAIYFLLACVWGLTLWLAGRVEPDRATILAGAVLFRTVLTIGSGTDGLTARGIAAVCDVAVVWIVSGMLPPGSRGTVALLAYAWNPLVMREFAGAGRIDALVVLLVLASVRCPGLGGGLLLGGAGWLQPAMLLLTPPLLRRGGWRALAGPTLAAAALAWLRPPVLREWVSTPAYPAVIFRFLFGGKPLAFGLAAAAVVAIAVWRARADDGSPSGQRRFALWVLGVLLLVSPAFHPWRLVWLLPFAALELSWFWLALSGSVFLSYHTGLGFREIPALTVLQFGMPALVWLSLQSAKS